MGCCGNKAPESSAAKKLRLYNEAIASGFTQFLAYKFAGYTDAEIEAMT